MKYLYVTGLEHSGTTLVTQLLAQDPRTLGLGELAVFFSPEHMKRYIELWGNNPDARLCSCGRTWDDCEFWGPISELNGLVSAIPVRAKYRRLIEHVRRKYGDDSAIIDSSKSLDTMKFLMDGAGELGLAGDDISAIAVIKDVRCFATSIKKKNGDRAGLVSHLRAFNWWLGTNRAMFDYFRDAGVRYQIVLYERLCLDPQGTLDRLLEGNGLHPKQAIDLAHRRSHIAMGNKNFLERSRDGIRYDNRWFCEDGINLAYLIHRRARRFNNSLYRNAPPE